MAIHELKIWPEYFQAIISGIKTHELRYNDRDYQVGDVLFLREYDPSTRTYTGNQCSVHVTYIYRGDEGTGFGLCSGYCIMSIRKSASEERSSATRYITADGKWVEGVYSLQTVNSEWRLDGAPGNSVELFHRENGGYVSTMTGTEFDCLRHVALNLKTVVQEDTIFSHMDYTSQIKSAMTCSDFFRVAVLLLDVYDNALYKLEGYPSFTSYVNKCLGKSQSYGSIYVTIARKFLNPLGTKSIFARGEQDFCMGDLIRLSSLSPEQINYLLDNGVINFSMSADALTDMVRRVKERDILCSDTTWAEL